ncbi:PKD domain-containing protein [Streptomyces sp. NPDC058534]|uniref:PKD domain-containing protein n=1 Tax=Streptomyces sp. NPDC058534 TaxID=3346541 RepID=UPI0036690745
MSGDTSRRRAPACRSRARSCQFEACVRHNYPAGQRNYTVELTVTDKGGNTATTSKQIQCWDLGNRPFCFGS